MVSLPWRIITSLADNYRWSPGRQAGKTTVPVMISSGHVKTSHVSNFVYIRPPVLEISSKNPVFDGFLFFLQLGVVDDT